MYQYIHVFVSHLVNEAELVRVAGRRVLEDILFYWDGGRGGAGEVAGDVSMQITNQLVLLFGDLLTRYNLDISHKLAEGFTNKYIINLSTCFT